MTCSKCGNENGRSYRAYCLPCTAAYKREWRRKHPDKGRVAAKNPEGQAKAKCRMIARNHLQRGKLQRDPCWACGSLPSEMHHPDYDRPLEPVWLCRPCHLKEHVADLRVGRTRSPRAAVSNP